MVEKTIDGTVQVLESMGMRRQWLEFSLRVPLALDLDGGISMVLWGSPEFNGWWRWSRLCQS